MKNNNETPVLADTGRGFSVVYNQRHLYSRTEPDLKISRIVDSLDLKENTLYILPSPLMFKGVEQIFNRLPSSSKLLCLEADEKLAEFSKKYVPPLQIPYLRTADTAVLLAFLEETGYTVFRKAGLIILSGGYTLNRPFYDKALEETEIFLGNFWKNKMTMIFMSRMWINNIFMNIASLDDNNGELSSFNTDRPVLIAGAGSSLEKKLDDILKFRKDLFLLSVDTALPVFLNSGIVPDAVVVIESQHYNLYDFLDLQQTKDIILFYDMCSHYKVHSIFKGKKIPFISRFSELCFFDELEKNSLLPYAIPPLGSVGLAGLYIAGIISGKTCGFIGLDFAYQPGKPHARGTESHKRLLFSSQRLANDDYSASSFSRSAKSYKNLSLHLKSDPVLYGYARQCMQLLSDGNYADCGTEGLLDYPDKLDISELAALAHTSSRPEVFIRKIFPDKRRITAFLKRKMDDLESVISIIRDNSFAWSENLIELIKKEDYITADFPENDIFSLDAGIMVPRVLASAERYRKTVEKALFITSENA